MGNLALPKTPTMKLSVITSPEDFYSLREEWNGLLLQSDSDVIFLRWEWLYNWWLVYGTGLHKLYILIVKENDRLVGIAPFYIRRDGLLFRKEISFLGTNVVCSDYMDLILQKGREKEVSSLMFSHLNERNDVWDTMRLTDIPQESRTLALITASFQDKRLKINKTHTTCPYLKLSVPWERIRDSYSSMIKNNLARKIKKFEDAYKGEIVEVGPEEDWDFYFDKLLFLNKLRMGQKNLNSSFLERQFVDFHKSIIQAFIKNNEVKFIFLRIGGKLIAGIYLLADHRRYYYYQSGFDPEWEKISPGTLLFDYAIKHAHKHGMEEFDFLQGNEKYKSLWTHTSRRNIKITVYKHSMANCVLSLYEDGKLGLKSWRRFLPHGEEE